MQMFAFKNTDAGIRRIQERRMQVDRRELDQELEVMRQRIDELESRVDEVRRPVVLELPKNRVYRSVFQKIEARTCRLFRISRSELYANRRQRQFSLARHFLMYWACRRTTLSLPQIARLMRRDHTTILHGKDAYPQKRAKMGRHLRAAR